MGCNCGGGSRSAYTATSGGSSWASAAANRGPDVMVWIVTYPDGRTQEFTSDSEAYRAIARTGGGIKSELRNR